MSMSLSGCLIVLLPGGGFAGHEPSPNVDALRQAGARVRVFKYPLNDVRAAYRSAVFPNAVLVGESAGGVVAAWAVAHKRARAAVTIGSPLDFRRWRPAHLRGGSWQWSPQRAYRGQRPLTTIQWSNDPFIPARPPAPGERQLTLSGVGHHNAPARTLIREVGRMCEAGR
jgi:pimeloyl-ACP methyl ester carboxylesterase